MGRITLFTIEECKFCRQTKAALSSRGIPYIEINIEVYPEKRSDMISLADHTTVPQVFFNNKHIGGSNETLATLSKWDEEITKDDGMDKTPYDRYVRLIKSQPEPSEQRLSIPEPSACEEMDFTTSRTGESVQLNKKEYTTLELTKLLIQNIPRDSLTYWGCMYYNCFTGSSGVTALLQMFDLISRAEAIQLGLKLQRKKYLHHVCNDHKFGDNEFYYRLQPLHTPSILNSFRVWSSSVDEEPANVIHRLKKLWSKLESSHLNDGKVDDASIHNDELYWKFEEDICELQSIDLKHMDDNNRKAFVINVYNLMIKYAFCKVGIANTTRDRSSFFGDMSINVGGLVYSFDDLEHGILRANTRHPYQPMKRFGIMDRRKHIALKSLDPRIHFALNCGANSCPPVKTYNVKTINDELQLAALAFCEDESNVSINEQKCELKLSKLFYWYMHDFVSSANDLPQKVAEYLRGEKRDMLTKLIELRKKGSISVTFLEYDWASNNINSREYKQRDLVDRSFFPYSSSPPQIYELVVQKEAPKE